MSERTDRRLTPTLTPLTAWAFSIGTSIGWGSLVVTSNTYLAQAGPLGSLLGTLAGMVVMLVISRNYHYLMNCIPDAGGAYAYSRDAFGFDHGFLTAWFLALTYLAILWANATSLPLFARYFIGDFFRWGYLYTIFGYRVYTGEVLLTVAALALAGVLCIRKKHLIERAMVALALLFSAGIAICFVAAMLGLKDFPRPEYALEGGAMAQIVRIACISPWAFIGFENISHAAEDLAFPTKKIFRVLALSVVATTLLYIFVTLLSVTAYPARYGSWVDYIRDLGNLSGIEGLPAFYAVRHYLGSFGVWALMLALLALVVTSLIGNTVALSRLFYALGKDGILPPRVAELNDQSLPGRATALIVGLSMLVPFLGRTAIGWIVDVTTIGATIVYGFVSASALKLARDRGDAPEQWTGVLGLAAMVAILLYLLLPNLFTIGTLETESYFLFLVWSMLGIIFFRQILKRDRAHHFGRSIVVWIGLLSLILFLSLVWMSQSCMQATTRAMSNVRLYYAQPGYVHGDSFINGQLDGIRRVSTHSILIVIAMFAVSLGALISNYTVMVRRMQTSEAELGYVRAVAGTDPLTGVKSKHAYVEYEKKLNARISAREAEPFAVVVCDVNGLKYVNDTRGHKAGDAFICDACRDICQVFPHSPVFRIGGDEFVAVLTRTDYEARDQLLAELNRRSEANIATDRAVVSAGMSEFVPGWDSTMRDPFERADALMYQRKHQLKAIGAKTR